MPSRVSIRADLLRLVLAVVLPLAALQAWNLYAAAQAGADAVISKDRFVAELESLLRGFFPERFGVSGA